MANIRAADRESSAAGAATRRSPLRKLYVQVLVAIAIGILLGHFYPSLGVEMKPLSDGFITLIRAVVPPIIFVTVAVGIAKMGDMRRVGVVGVRAIIYFEVVSTLALFIGLAVGNLLQPGAGLHIDPAQLDEKAIAGYVTSAKSLTIVDFLMRMIPSNLVGAVAQGDILPVLVMAILFGFALCLMGERGGRLVGLMDDFMHALFGVVRIVMYVAPLAAFGAMAFTIGKYGITALGPLLKLILTFYLTCIVFVVVILGAVCWAVGFNIFRYLAYIKEEILLTLATSSSEPALPTLMSKMEKLGCSKSLVGLVVPTGYTFNTDGSSMYMTLAALFIAQATNTHLTLGQQLTIFIVAVLTSKGASGVQGAAFIALVGTLTVIPTIPVAGMALLLGIDRFMSMARAMVNMLGNGVATLVVARWEKEIDGKTLTKNMAKPQPVASVPEPVNAGQSAL